MAMRDQNGAGTSVRGARRGRARFGTRPSRSAGFTVLEVLIAIALLAVGFTAVFALLMTANTAHRRAVDQTAAATLAASVFDDISLRYAAMYRDGNGNGIPDTFEDLDGNGVEDRFERFGVRPPIAEEMPNRQGYNYTLRYYHGGIDASPREIVVRCAVTWEERGESLSQVFHRIVFLKRDAR
jgi:prepilin-type N-terminal cleavage/methylation domain-containing protein